jgi:PEP-CTERM motif
MRFGFWSAAIVLALLVAGSPPAQAGLVGNGTNTVEASFWLPVFGSPTTSPPPETCTTLDPCELQTPESTPPYIPVDFQQGAISLSTISVGDTRIVITNEGTVPFCSTALPCSDPFVGFEFVFSSGVDITGVSVDSASSTDFLPNDTAPHNGLQLLSPTRIVVDVTGDAPSLGDKLMLDLTFPSVTPTVPEASTWAMMLLGFAGLGFAGWRRMAAKTT